MKGIDRRTCAVRRGLYCAVLLGLGLASAEAVALSTYSADATAITPAGFDANTDTGSGLAPDGAAVTGAGASGPNASAGATAQAGFQYVGVSASATGSGAGANSNANARTQSEFSIVPTDPTLWGTVGEIDIALSVNGSTGVGAERAEPAETAELTRPSSAAACRSTRRNPSDWRNASALSSERRWMARPDPRPRSRRERRG